MVISPYSSFLALVLEPEDAAKNLRRLERFGAFGRWGFIEALDFTPGRCRRDDGEKVRCYMAHHAGMSVIAAANLAVSIALPPPMPIIASAPCSRASFTVSSTPES